jgi:putative hemolysin
MSHPVLVGQISRGLSPASAIVSACRVAHTRRWRYHLIDTLPCADAKAAQAALAVKQRSDLLLVEDDILLPDAQWPWPKAGVVQAVSATCPDSGGQLNYVQHRNGTVLYVGTCLMLIPLQVLLQVGPPWFEARHTFHVKDDQLIPGGDRDTERGSDVFFCWRLQEHHVPIELCGHATVLAHPLTKTGLTQIDLVT